MYAYFLYGLFWLSKKGGCSEIEGERCPSHKDTSRKARGGELKSELPEKASSTDWSSRASHGPREQPYSQFLPAGPAWLARGLTGGFGVRGAVAPRGAEAEREVAQVGAHWQGTLVVKGAGKGPKLSDAAQVLHRVVVLPQ